MIPSPSFRTAPHYLGGALATGAVGRLLKNLYDLNQRGPTESIVKLPEDTGVSTSIPVEVSDEEAEQLRSRGIQVKSAAIGLIAEPLAVGAGTGAALYGGWKLTDSIIDKWRKREAKKEIEGLRSRLQAVLDDDPADRDQPLHTIMKAASDEYFAAADADGNVKEAAVGLLAGGLGAAGFFGGLKAYNAASRDNRHTVKSKGLAKLLEQYRAKKPAVRLMPYVRNRPEKDEDEETPQVEEQVEIAESVVVPTADQTVNVGSPSDQAEDKPAEVRSTQPATQSSWF